MATYYVKYWNTVDGKAVIHQMYKNYSISKTLVLIPKTLTTDDKTKIFRRLFIIIILGLLLLLLASGHLLAGGNKKLEKVPGKIISQVDYDYKHNHLLHYNFFPILYGKMKRR